MSSLDRLDPRTPVIIGVGQASERIDDPEYKGLSPVELAAAAARSAIEDTGADVVAVTAAIDVLASTRQFDTSQPGSPSPLGRSTNFPRSVAASLGADPARAILEVVGGQSPQRLVNEFAAAIARGDAQVALVTGAEAISTIRHLAKSEDKPDFSDAPEGDIEDRGYGLKGLTNLSQVAHGLTDAPSQYALLENARRGRLGLTRDDYSRKMGEVFAPFTEIAERNPHSAAPVRRSAEELVGVTERNRMIATPYPRFVVARDQVNQGAAVIVTSVETARRLGVPEDRWVYLHGHADLREKDLMVRPDMGSSPASVRAVEHALDVAGVTVDDIAFFDLYSCFPIAVLNICDGLGLSPTDPRGLTLTGGLPFFGGAGNNYSAHAIAEAVVRTRANRGALALVGANGGTLSKYSVGIYSTTPTPWKDDCSPQIQAQLATEDSVEVASAPSGWAIIETCTVKHTRSGTTTIVVGRLPDGRRFLANGDPRDTELTKLLDEGEPLGEKVFVRTFGFGVRVALTAESMSQLFPERVPNLDREFEHIIVRRDGHLLEITINRPESRNSLHPPAHEELEEAFDAYFADSELWVAILTGAGTDAFSAGNDLIYTRSGKPMYMPISGFAGLTSRAHLPKPVIAAVNGFAMGGGFETALACHLVVADEDAKFALSEVKVGLIAGAGGVVRLPRTIPEKIANELILTGRRLNAAEAAELGVVNAVVPSGTAVEGARELAARILEGSPTSVRMSLRLMEETRGIADVVDAVTHPSEVTDDLMLSDDALEGLTAFAQKRAPRWRNR